MKEQKEEPIDLPLLPSYSTAYSKKDLTDEKVFSKVFNIYIEYFFSKLDEMKKKNTVSYILWINFNFYTKMIV